MKLHDEPECLICWDPFREPVATLCGKNSPRLEVSCFPNWRRGHIFCASCFFAWRKNWCPYCQRLSLGPVIRMKIAHRGEASQRRRRRGGGSQGTGRTTSGLAGPESRRVLQQDPSRRVFAEMDERLKRGEICEITNLTGGDLVGGDFPRYFVAGWTGGLHRKPSN